MTRTPENKKGRIALVRADNGQVAYLMMQHFSGFGYVKTNLKIWPVPKSIVEQKRFL